MPEVCRPQAAMWHPDRNGHTLELARRKFDEVNLALDILSDETTRRQYDLRQFKSVFGVCLDSVVLPIAAVEWTNLRAKRSSLPPLAPPNPDSLSVSDGGTGGTDIVKGRPQETRAGY